MALKRLAVVVLAALALVGCDRAPAPTQAPPEPDACYRAAQVAYWLNDAWHGWRRAQHNYDAPGQGTDEQLQILRRATGKVDDLQDKFERWSAKCAAKYPEVGNGKA